MGAAEEIRERNTGEEYGRGIRERNTGEEYGRGIRERNTGEAACKEERRPECSRHCL